MRNIMFSLAALTLLTLGCGASHKPYVTPVDIHGNKLSSIVPPVTSVTDPALLGTAQNFVVMAGSAITNTGPSILNADVGLSPGSAVTGFPPGSITGGILHISDAVAVQAQVDLTTAYNLLASAPSDFDLTGQDLGGLTLTPGVYTFSSSAQLTGQLVLDDQGDPDALFIFQIGSTLTTASNSSVRMTNPDRICGHGVYWQVGSSATLGTGTFFEGTIVALTSITLNTGANMIEGRALARNGAVTLDGNVILRP